MYANLKVRQFNLGLHRFALYPGLRCFVPSGLGGFVVSNLVVGKNVRQPKGAPI